MENFKYAKKSAEKRQFTVNTDISAVPPAAAANMKRFAVSISQCPEIRAVTVSKPIPESVKKSIEKAANAAVNGGGEAFVICKNGGDIAVYAGGDRGILYGLMTFLRLLDSDGCFCYDSVYDHPESGFRGIKLLMPGREEIKYFKAFIDCMLYFRHNTVMLEIGGAMEYKRHPEINEGWEEYAAFMSEYSGKSQKLQENTYPWRKNSIHSNNGAGSYLTQAEVKDLIKYCNDRGVSIIPEVPSTSHCDYLLTRHPELAERPEDPYPDTFCPSNPDSYRLLFDVLDEVIEVFNPEIINIGHDEYYSINICDRCRKRLMTNYEILAEDLTKIHGYLAAKGVKTMIWCDKLMNVETEDGQNFGGALNRIYKNWNAQGELLAVLRPTWQARDMIPKDIICMNWFWSYGERYDGEVKDFPVVFGNFRGYGMNNYRKRCGNNCTGGMCSDWGATSPVYLQRNCIYIGMAYNDRLYWDGTYDDTDDAQFKSCLEQCFKLLFDYNYGVEANRADKYIEITHTTDRFTWYHEFVDGIFTDGEEYRKGYYLGYYNVSYTDGTFFNKETFLGENIGYDSAEWYGKLVDVKADEGTPGIRNARLEPKLGETAYSTLPVLIDGKIYYKYLFENPYPEKQISDIKFVLSKDATWSVSVL